MDQKNQPTHTRRQDLSMNPVVSVVVHAEHHIASFAGGRVAKRSDRTWRDLTVGRKERDPRAFGRAHTSLERCTNSTVDLVAK
jgi:hypothetical protein